jgi:hypothetical protein
MVKCERANLDAPIILLSRCGDSIEKGLPLWHIPCPTKRITHTTKGHGRCG